MPEKSRNKRRTFISAICFDIESAVVVSSSPDGNQLVLAFGRASNLNSQLQRFAATGDRPASLPYE
jgi:hypothetical protein